MPFFNPFLAGILASTSLYLGLSGDLNRIYSITAPKQLIAVRRALESTLPIDKRDPALFEDLNSQDPKYIHLRNQKDIESKLTKDELNKYTGGTTGHFRSSGYIATKDGVKLKEESLLSSLSPIDFNYLADLFHYYTSSNEAITGWNRIVSETVSNINGRKN